MRLQNVLHFVTYITQTLGREVAVCLSNCIQLSRNNEPKGMRSHVTPAHARRFMDCPEPAPR